MPENLPSTVPISLYRNREWSQTVTVQQDVTGFDLALVIIPIVRGVGSNPPVLTNKSPTLTVSSGVSTLVFVAADADTANLTPGTSYQWQCLGRETGAAYSDVLQAGAVIVLDSPAFPS